MDYIKQFADIFSESIKSRTENFPQIAMDFINFHELVEDEWVEIRNHYFNLGFIGGDNWRDIVTVLIILYVNNPQLAAV